MKNSSEIMLLGDYFFDKQGGVKSYTVDKWLALDRGLKPGQSTALKEAVKSAVLAGIIGCNPEAAKVKTTGRAEWEEAYWVQGDCRAEFKEYYELHKPVWEMTRPRY